MRFSWNGWRRPVVGLAVAALVAAAACIDYGYEAPELPDSPSQPNGDLSEEGEEGEEGEDCIEGPTSPTADGEQVHFASMNIDRPLLEITPGTIVTWTNTDSMTHTVTSGSPTQPLAVADGGFDSGDLTPGSSFAYRFCAVRSVTYFCRPHKAMMFGFRIEIE